MNIHITFGTEDYLASLKNSHRKQRLLLMSNLNSSVLLHETDGKSFFNEPKSYQVINGSGKLTTGNFAVLNNIPVREEGRALFEDRYRYQAQLIEQEKGLQAIRLLRPTKRDTYIIFTLWQRETDYNTWIKSKTSNQKKIYEGIDKTSIFPRPSYVATYTVLK
ncbi:antibiotic biosynthesis monooxygenase family protein [Bacillus solimangrovi]|uniref:ABM domain-containing protein n=1 Tax=Bacillus solimangrovi TaxID=1305675 RepID=A0A1E5LE89_9BACI|nr:antibiotic biosynthesis monooxygenase [Bacillus solimangrovi]OEH92401.1 hypothetical protein BFG57_15950 [Bacillus solimangrovi]